MIAYYPLLKAGLKEYEGKKVDLLVDPVIVKIA